MNKAIEKLTASLVEIGACWAVTWDKCVLANDGYDARPTYHIHPDASDPRQNAILRMDTQDEIKSYVKAVREARAAGDDWGVEYGDGEWFVSQF